MQKNKAKLIYILGSIVLFLGLIWMLLPHAAHGEVAESLTGNGEDALEESHLTHTLEGLIATVVGLILMAYTEKQA
ncbi:MAG TPA: hypothetical protein VJK51_03225 [Candidatus Nanoarchaeia archaeon]|nr:hypothetical protein [Candidatus Nanoarchaeia archaeon]